MLKESYKSALWNIFDKTRETIAELEATISSTPSPWRLSVCAGIGMLLGDLYMSVERILRLFIENVYREKIVKDEEWHKRCKFRDGKADDPRKQDEDEKNPYRSAVAASPRNLERLI